MLRRASRVLLLLALLLPVGGCASLTPPTTPPVLEPQVHSRLMDLLHGMVVVQTQLLLAWHPDALPHLLDWLDAICRLMPGTANGTQLQALLLGTLDTVPMPDWTRGVLREFTIVTVNMIPLALRLTGAAVPGADAVLLVVNEVCAWIRLAASPALSPAGLRQ